jgi:hypothetical protein
MITTSGTSSADFLASFLACFTAVFAVLRASFLLTEETSFLASVTALTVEVAAGVVGTVTFVCSTIGCTSPLTASG